MKSLRIALAPALSLALLVGSSLTPVAAMAQTPPPTATSGAGAMGWPQETSDLKPDPLIRFGRLPNGMRYALMHNATPSGQASFRLRFDAGSLMERDDQQGLAHFLEHMAFNGSAHVPTGEMVKILERIGLAFGADTNASTDFTETVYKFDLPKADNESLDTGLLLMRDIAGELIIPQASINSEKGVVLSEERVRDDPNYRAYKAQANFFYPNQLVSKRLPIGQVSVIQNATHDLIADLYDKYYRPERAVFIAVGDFDVDAMESKVKARFSDWKDPRPVGAEPNLGTPEKRGFEAKVYSEQGLRTSLQVAWIKAPDHSPDTRAKRRRDMVERLGLSVLNRRLGRIARSNSPPFLSAGAYSGDEEHSAKVAALSINANGTDWKKALDAAIKEEKRVVQYGVLQGELDREIEDLRASLKERAAGQATRRTPNLATGIVGSLDDKLIVTNPTQDLELFEDSVKGLKADEVSAALRLTFSGSGPLVFLATSAPIEGGDGALASAFKVADSAPVGAPEAVADKTWPYDSFGPPGKVAERTVRADVGATFVRFANGVRLTVKPTDFRKDQVQVQVRIGDGRLDLPKDKPSAAWASSALIEGGLKKVTAEELDQIMTKRIVGASFSIDDDAFSLGGATRPADLAAQLQILAAYATDSGFRPEAFSRVQTYAATLQDQMEATASGVVGRDLSLLMHNGDQRWAFPTKQTIGATKADDFKGLIGPRLANGPVEVVVVGDTTVDQAIAAVASTFGALPQRSGPALPTGARQVSFPPPSPQPINETHKGRADQGYAVTAWPTTDLFADVRGARTIRVLVNVMQLRLIDTLRVAQGATYSPNATLEASEDYPGYGYIAARVEIPPSKIPGFYEQVDKIAADLRANGPTEDEMKRAVLPRIEALTKAMQTNEFWIGSLEGAQTDPRKLEVVLNQISQLQSITADDVKKVANKWLVPGKEWRFQVTPEAKTAAQ
ncbi:MAG: M16 family metallopeptidase [Caulobacteraceae bacterium]